MSLIPWQSVKQERNIASRSKALTSARASATRAKKRRISPPTFAVLAPLPLVLINRPSGTAATMRRTSMPLYRYTTRTIAAIVHYDHLLKLYYPPFRRMPYSSIFRLSFRPSVTVGNVDPWPFCAAFFRLSISARYLDSDIKLPSGLVGRGCFSAHSAPDSVLSEMAPCERGIK